MEINVSRVYDAVTIILKSNYIMNIYGNDIKHFMKHIRKSIIGFLNFIF